MLHLSYALCGYFYFSSTEKLISFFGGKDYSRVWMVAVVHVNISVCSRVGIPATRACMGHPVCGYHGFLGRILLFSCWCLWPSCVHLESPKKLSASHWAENICLWRRLPVRGLLNCGHLNTVLSLETVSSKLRDTETGLCSSVIPMAVFHPLWEV